MQCFLDLLSWGVVSIFENVKYKIALLYAWYPFKKYYVHENDNKIMYNVEKQNKTLNWWSITILWHLMENKNISQKSGPLTLFLPDIFHKVHPKSSWSSLRENEVGGWGCRVEMRAKEVNRANSSALSFSWFCILCSELCEITPFHFKLKPFYLI